MRSTGNWSHLPRDAVIVTLFEERDGRVSAITFTPGNVPPETVFSFSF